ncbi:unnamed protein product [Rangifer tarandus platyrhynchus]|uniref:Uncharacterized protein n=1 Tax=Rangifer tarandus platyrhynchus TaxID=3082113 RepID=A0ABN8XJ33_RANTA|nr:unnamed protein product [Rangifer tarandus platyrhynchus]
MRDFMCLRARITVARAFSVEALSSPTFEGEGGSHHCRLIYPSSGDRPQQRRNISLVTLRGRRLPCHLKKVVAAKVHAEQRASVYPQFTTVSFFRVSAGDGLFPAASAYRLTVCTAYFPKSTRRGEARIRRYCLRSTRENKRIGPPDIYTNRA